MDFALPFIFLVSSVYFDANLNAHVYPIGWPSIIVVLKLKRL